MSLLLAHHPHSLQPHIQTMTQVEMQRATKGIETLRSKNGLRPAVSLPTEILVQVFILACIPNLSFTWEHLKDGLPPQTTRTAIAATCSRWRNIVLSTPDCWRAITVYPHMLEQRGKGKEVAPALASQNALSLQTERARSKSLSMFLAQFPSRADGQDAKQRLGPMLKQCRALYAMMCPQTLLEILHVPLHLPILDTLMVFTYPPWQEQSANGPNISIDLTLAQSLREFALGSFRPDQAWMTFSLPQTCNLRTLCIIGKISPRCVFDALQSCPQLEVLRWRCWDQELDEEWEDLSLHSLSQLYVSGPVPQALLATLDAPNLQHLRFGFPMWETLSSAYPLHDVTKFPELRRLDIEQTEVSEWHEERFSEAESRDVLVPFLNAHHALQDIRFLQRPLDEAIAARLGFTHFLPDLEHVWAVASGDVLPAKLFLDVRLAAEATKCVLHLYVEDDEARDIKDTVSELMARYPDHVVKEKYQPDFATLPIVV